MQWYFQTGAGERDDIADTDPPATLTYEPTHEILVLIALLNNQGTGELVQTCSLAIALPAHIIKLWM